MTGTLPAEDWSPQLAWSALRTAGEGAETAPPREMSKMFCAKGSSRRAASGGLLPGNIEDFIWQWEREKNDHTEEEEDIFRGNVLEMATMAGAVAH